MSLLLVDSLGSGPLLVRVFSVVLNYCFNKEILSSSNKAAM